MSSEIARLLVEMGLKDDGLDSGLSNAEGKLGKFGKLAVAGFTAAGAAGVAAAVKGVMAFSDFERSMNEVFTLLPGISSSAMDAMEGQVKRFATEFGVLPDKVVPALYQALSAGVPQDNVFTFLETAQKAAKGGVTDLTTAVDGISSVVNSYGAEIIDATKASDLMFTAVRLGKTNFEELSASLFQVNPTAAALGVQFGDVTAALATMTAQGVPTSVATTQLRQAFVEMSKEGSKTASLFEDMAGKSFKDFIASGGNVQGALQLLEQHASDAGIGINDLFGSVEAGGAALALTGGGTESFSRALDEMGSAAGATDAAFQQMDRGIGPVFDRLKARGAVALIDIGDGLVSLGEKGLKGFRSLTSGFEDNAAGFGQAIDSMLGGSGRFEGVFTTVGEVIITVGRTAKDVVEGIASFLSDNRETFAEWGAKIGEVAAVVGATLKSAFDLIVTIFNVAVGIIGPIWNQFGDDIMRIIGVVVSTVIDVVKAAFDIVRGIFDVFRGIFTGDWGLMWDGIKAILGGVWDAITAIVGGAIDFVKGLLRAGWDAIKDAVGSAWDWIKDRIGGVIDWFRGVPGMIKDAAAGMFDGIKDAFRAAVNFIIRGWNNIEFRIPGFKIGPIGFDGFTLGLPDIPQLATGGTIRRAGLAMVGERGPELLNLPRGADVIPLNRSGGSAVGGGDINIRVEGSVITERDLMTFIRTELRRAGVRTAGNRLG